MASDDKNPSGGSEEKEEHARLQQYKNVAKNEDHRRRRTECTVEIRKQKGSDLMMKRRNIQNDNADEDADSHEPPNTSTHLSNDEIKAILSVNPSVEDMSRCFETLRKTLSKTKNPPIDQVIQSGLLHALIAALSLPNTRIQYEAAWALTNVVSGTSAQTIAAVEAGATEPLVKLIVHSDGMIAEQALWAVANMAGDSPQLRDYIVRCHGMEALMHVVERVGSLQITHARTVAWAFSNFCRHKNAPAATPVLRQIARGLKKLLVHPDRQVRQDACWAVSYLTDGGDEQIEVARESGVLWKIVPLLDDAVAAALVAPALRTLGNVATGNDALTQCVIEMGVLEKLGPLMAERQVQAILKESTWLVSNIIAGTRKQIQAVLDAGLLPHVVKTLQVGDHKSQMEAGWALSNLAQGGNPQQIVTMFEECAVPALCAALSSTNTDMLNNALETLYALLQTMETSYPQKLDLLRDQIEQHGGLDAFERLQESSCSKVYSQAYRIITHFFSDDVDGPVDGGGDRYHLKNLDPSSMPEFQWFF